MPWKTRSFEGKKTPKGRPIGNDGTSRLAIRKAVNYAIDGEALVACMPGGFGRPAFGVVDDLTWDNPGFYSNPVVDNYLDQVRAAESFDVSIPLL